MALLIKLAVPAVVNLGGEVNNANVGGLKLLPLGGDGTETVCDFIALLWHILSLDVRDVEKEVLTTIVRNNEAVTFGSAEELHLALHLWVADGYVTRGLGAGATGDDG